MFSTSEPIQDGAVIARSCADLRDVAEMFSTETEGKKYKECDLHSDSVVLSNADRVTSAPAIHPFLTVFMAASGEERRKAPSR